MASEAADGAGAPDAAGTGANSTRAILAAFSANLGIAVAKFVAFAFTGAASLLAEAIHSVADTANQAFLLLGGRRARHAPTPEHPFGFGAERYFWSFVVALVIFSVGSLFALAEGIDKLVHPHSIESPAWAVGTLLLAAVLEGFSLRTARREALTIRRTATWWSFVRRTKVPELPVVLLEDTGALIGLGCALVGTVLAAVTGNARFDAAGSVAIGLLLGVIAVVLAVEMKSLLIGEAADPEQEAAVRAAIADGPEVGAVIHLRTLHLGPDEVLVGMKLHFECENVAELARMIDVVEARVRAAVPEATVIYVEPDVLRIAPDRH